MHILRFVLNYDPHGERFAPNALADCVHLTMEQLKSVGWPLYIMLNR